MMCRRYFNFRHMRVHSGLLIGILAMIWLAAGTCSCTESEPVTGSLFSPDSTWQRVRSRLVPMTLGLPADFSRGTVRDSMHGEIWLSPDVRFEIALEDRGTPVRPILTTWTLPFTLKSSRHCWSEAIGSRRAELETYVDELHERGAPVATAVVPHGDQEIHLWIRGFPSMSKADTWQTFLLIMRSVRFEDLR